MQSVAHVVLFTPNLSLISTARVHLLTVDLLVQHVNSSVFVLSLQAFAFGVGKLHVWKS